MFKVEDDSLTKYRHLKLFNRTIFKWIRRKTILTQLECLSRSIAFTGSQALHQAQAVGVMRDVQLVQLKFLKAFSSFAHKHQLTFWLDFGTLLGAQRTGRFIPWDDDIDITMPRCDYERVLALKEDLPSGYYLEFNATHGLIKLRHRSLSAKIGLDIFVIDHCKTSLKVNECVQLSQKVIALQKKAVARDFATAEARAQHLKDLRHQLPLEMEQVSAEACHSLVYGLEFCHASHPSVILPKRMVYPLATIEFEGHQYPCPYDVHGVLTLLYGDYRVVSLDKVTHVQPQEFTLEEVLDIYQFAHHD